MTINVDGHRSIPHVLAHFSVGYFVFFWLFATLMQKIWISPHVFTLFENNALLSLQFLAQLASKMSFVLQTNLGKN